MTSPRRAGAEDVFSVRPSWLRTAPRGGVTVGSLMKSPGPAVRTRTLPLRVAPPVVTSTCREPGAVAPGMRNVICVDRTSYSGASTPSTVTRTPPRVFGNGKAEAVVVGTPVKDPNAATQEPGETGWSPRKLALLTTAICCAGRVAQKSNAGAKILNDIQFA